MRKFGLIGFPLSHSFSKKYFEEKFQRKNLIDCNYSLFELEQINDIINLRLTDPNLVGLNVTIPYKQSIIPYLDGLSERAQKVGAVNTIKVKNGTWIGHNTDIHGFQRTLEPLLQTKRNAALILGTGGASLAVKYVLNQLSIPFCMVSRTEKEGCILYNQLNESILSKYNIIINTTPLGMFPNFLEMPEIPFQFINSSHVFYDLIYNPELTLLLKTAKDKGCVVKNGLEMLQIQAEKSWEIWNDDNQ